MQRSIFSLLLLGLLLSLYSCTSHSSDGSNPPVTGFNLQDSDPKAMEIADAVMASMGGRSAWDETRYIRWTFFGLRSHLWDKQKRRVRIESPRENRVYLLNYGNMTGKVFQNDTLVTNPDSIPIYLEQARRYWINDSYWLVMPFKLKDRGVTLKYLRQEDLPGGFPADVLELTFEAVGVTPQNKYHVWVDQEGHLVRQWAYFSQATDEEPRFTLPWLDYQPYGNILLSGKRGERELAGIAVLENVNEGTFTDL